MYGCGVVVVVVVVVVLFDEREGMWSRNREWDRMDGDWLTNRSLGISK